MNLILTRFKKQLIAVTKDETGHYDDNTGDWVEGGDVKVNFQGSILPLTTRDLNQLQTTAPGLFTVDDKKLYTEYPTTFLNQTIIKDGDKQYQIYVVKDYDIINSNFKLYYIKKIDKVER